MYLLILLGASGCAVSPPGSSGPPSERAYNPGSYTLPQQQPPPEDIQSVQLYAGEEPANPPVIELGSPDKLTLSFDYINEQNRQFRVEISHRTQIWQESSIAPAVYMDSFFHSSIVSAQKSLSQRPAYHHVEYQFPNNQLKLKASGNYFLEVYSHDGLTLLFSMPFFVTEEQGDLQTRVETLYAQRSDSHPVDQPFSTYRYPDFVEFPQFDLSLSYVPGRYWGRMRVAGQLDTSTPGELNGHLSRSASYIADDHFNFLNLSAFDADGRQIVEYQPQFTPPRVRLRRDVLHLDQPFGYSPGISGGYPSDGRSGNYARVQFFLEAGDAVGPEAELYVIGGFNNWLINSRNRMSYNAGNGLWEGDALIKQGQYHYTYVQLEDNEVNNLSPANRFPTPQRRYMTFVYFKDPTHRYDRLLKVAVSNNR